MQPLGIAVVGSGFIGPVHIEALRRLGRPVLGVLGSTPERSQLAAERLGLSRAYANLAEVLKDPEVRVVHLTTPNRFHFDEAKQAIRAGKHVICEKPLGMTSLETAELTGIAQDASVVTAVCYNVRFYPSCLQARELVRSGEVGRIFHITGSYLQDWLLHETDFNWRVLVAKGGELRAIADIGTHWLDLITFITGLEVEAVCADLYTVHPVRQAPKSSVETFASGEGLEREPIEIDTDDYGSVLIRFKGGARAAFTVSQVSAGRKNCIRFDIAGAKASLTWDSEEPNSLTVGHRGAPNHVYPRDPALLTGEAGRFSDYPGGHAEGFPDTFKQMFKSIYAAIDAKERGEPLPAEPLYATFADGHREVLLCEAILESHRDQTWVGV